MGAASRLRAGRRSAGEVTVRDWLAAHGQAPRLIELFWEPLALAALNQPIDQAAAGTFVEILSRLFGPDAERASLVLPAVPLDELYAEPAREWLEARHAEVRTKSAARVVIEGDRVVGVEVRGDRLRAPVVICAAPVDGPWRRLPACAGRPGRAARQSGGHRPFAHCHGQPLVRPARAGRDAPGAAGPRVPVGLRQGPAASARAVAPVPGLQWGGRRRAADQRRADRDGYARSPREASRRLGEARVLHASAVRERQATFSLAPGQPPRPGTRTAVRGLLLAGDWVDTGLPATIEGAVISGHWAAAAARTRD